MGAYQRRHENAKPDDQRSQGAVDRDRVLYSSAYRRLDGVTQVVAPEEGHVFHNRLTHSMKVGQLARRIAERVSAFVGQKSGLRLPDPEVAEGVGFAHDLGHPPFGHVAEKALDQLVTKHGLPDGYEGNAQTFRILTKLSVRSTKYGGLNLTRATLDGVLKYPWYRADDKASKRFKKWGAYRTEQKDFEFCRGESRDDKQGIETQCMELADDIAYSVHDAEDFYRAGLIPLHRLVSRGTAERPWSPEAELFFEEVKSSARLGTQDIGAYQQALAEALEYFAIEHAYVGGTDQRALLRYWTSHQIQAFVNEIQIKVEDDRIVLALPDSLRARAEILKQLIWHYVILNPRLATQQTGFQYAINSMFEVYLDAVKAEKWHVLPRRMADWRKDDSLFSALFEGLPEDQLRVRLVADVIAGMTDREALIIHRRFQGLAPGSVLDGVGA